MALEILFAVEEPGTLWARVLVAHLVKGLGQWGRSTEELENVVSIE